MMNPGAFADTSACPGKEDCPDLRNTRVVDIVRELQAANAQVDVHDPLADLQEAERELGIRLVEQPEQGAYDAVVLAVAHSEFQDSSGGRARDLLKGGGVVFDTKSILPSHVVDGRL